MPDIEVPSLALLPEVEARAMLGGKPIRLRLLKPQHAVLGIGTLRVLRVAERGERTELVVGYDGYERIDVRDATAAER